METNKPMALRLADKHEYEGFLSDHKFSQNQWCSQASVELRRLHAENTLLQSGYDAARMEIASLHERLESSKKANDAWAAKKHALEAKNLGLLHALTAEQDENHALHQQLAAIGAGGVEPLRKRECLHSISEPDHFRGATKMAATAQQPVALAEAHAQAGEYPVDTGNPEADRIIGRLASSDPDFDDCADAVSLTHKLMVEHIGPDGFATWKDAAIAYRAARAATQAASAPVVLPEPDAVLRFERSTAGKENEMPSVVSCNWLPDGEYKLYTEQQVRAMLATGWHHRKPNCITCNDHGAVGNILTAEPCPDCTPPQAQADARDALEEAASVLSSINKGASHEVTVDDEVCYWQRKEWIDWAEKEVLPKVRAAIDAARAAQWGV